MHTQAHVNAYMNALHFLALLDLPTNEEQVHSTKTRTASAGDQIGSDYVYRKYNAYSVDIHSPPLLLHLFPPFQDLYTHKIPFRFANLRASSPPSMEWRLNGECVFYNKYFIKIAASEGIFRTKSALVVLLDLILLLLFLIVL